MYITLSNLLVEKNEHNNYDRMITVQNFIVKVIFLSCSNQVSINRQKWLYCRQMFFNIKKKKICNKNVTSVKIKLHTSGVLV